MLLAFTMLSPQWITYPLRIATVASSASQKYFYLLTYLLTTKLLLDRGNRRCNLPAESVTGRARFLSMWSLVRKSRQMTFLAVDLALRRRIFKNLTNSGKSRFLKTFI